MILKIITIIFFVSFNNLFSLILVNGTDEHIVCHANYEGNGEKDAVAKGMTFKSIWTISPYFCDPHMDPNVIPTKDNNYYGVATEIQKLIFFKKDSTGHSCIFEYRFEYQELKELDNLILYFYKINLKRDDINNQLNQIILIPQLSNLISNYLLDTAEHMEFYSIKEIIPEEFNKLGIKIIDQNEENNKKRSGLCCCSIQ